MKHAAPKICLSIAGLDPSGGAGVLADVKTFAAFQCYGAAAVTSVTYQNTVGVFGVSHLKAESVRKQSEAVLSDLRVAAAKTGMLPTHGIIREVADLISKFRIADLVVDPVVRSTSGYDLISDSALRTLVRDLFPLAIIITPNLQEAERITRMIIRTESDIRIAADLMLSMGAKNVLVKGGHFAAQIKKGSATDYLFGPDGEHTFESAYLKTDSTHGTGCTLSAAITACLAGGATLTEAVSSAKEYVTRAIATAGKIGCGHSPVNHLVG